MHGLVGHGAFTPLYFELDVDDFVREVLQALMTGARDVDPAPIEAELHAGAAAAELCLERCERDIDINLYEIVAFSVLFDTQKIPSVTLARRLKRRRPSLKIVFGGTGCDGEMGMALLEHFPDIDGVVQGDADRSIGDLCRWLVHPSSGPCPAGLLTRHGPSEHPPPIVQVRDERQAPDFSQFIEQRGQSAYSAVGKLTVLFEASRGCWWGDKRHCLFCGIRAVREGYRERAVDAVVAEIIELFERYQPALLYATDAILSRDQAHDMLPRLADFRASGHEALNLFFEVKSNMSRRDVALLAAAGVVAVQPGIESLSSAVLARIGKGATARKQVEVLKWLGVYGIETIYGLLLRTPGETPDDIREQVRIVQKIHHLPPPIGINPLALHRFSPYFADPVRYSITRLRPHMLQRLAYRGADELLMRLCYEFAFDSPEYESAENRQAEEELRQALDEWKDAYARGACLSITSLDGRTLVTRGTDGFRSTRALDEVEAACLAAAERSLTPRALGLAIQLSEEPLHGLIGSLAREGLLLSVDNQWLSLVTPARVDAFIDAGL
jgi:ribosomal peptide maturation radical SAM protein 1